MAVQPYYANESSRDVPLSDAALSVWEAAEQLLRESIQLMRLEAVDAAREAATAIASFVVAALLAAFAWVATSVAIGFLLARWLPADGAAASVAGLNAAAAGGLVLLARHRSGGAAKEG